MGRILVHEFMSLDGVIDAPMWTFEYGFTDEMSAVLSGVMEPCRGILLGRTTYQEFEPAWSVRTAEDDPGAPFFNDTMKYVVSGSLTDATWRNSEIVGPYDADRIRALRDEVGDLWVSGSGTLVRALVGDGLVDGVGDGDVVQVGDADGEADGVLVVGETPRTYMICISISSSIVIS